MNNKIKNTFRLGIMAAAGAAAMASCSDTWDDHYKADAAIEFNGTTLQAIEEMAPDFAKVIRAYGFDNTQNQDVSCLSIPSGHRQMALSSFRTMCRVVMPENFCEWLTRQMWWITSSRTT